jgi:hypothetical protein
MIWQPLTPPEIGGAGHDRDIRTVVFHASAARVAVLPAGECGAVKAGSRHPALLVGEARRPRPSGRCRAGGRPEAARRAGLEKV